LISQTFAPLHPLKSLESRELAPRRYKSGTFFRCLASQSTWAFKASRTPRRQNGGHHTRSSLCKT
jgi:hypothetical protein